MILWSIGDLDLAVDVITKRYSLGVDLSAAINKGTYGYTEYKVHTSHDYVSHAHAGGSYIIHVSNRLATLIVVVFSFVSILVRYQVIFSSWSREGRISTKLDPTGGTIVETEYTMENLFPGFLYKIEIFPRLKRTGAFTAVPKYPFLTLIRRPSCSDSSQWGILPGQTFESQLIMIKSYYS